LALNRNEPDRHHLEKLQKSIRQCLLFRVEGRGKFDAEAISGTAIYATSTDEGETRSYLAGFVSFEVHSRQLNRRGDEHYKQDMDNDEFRVAATAGGVDFFGAWELPSRLVSDYEIVLVSELTNAE
jgi:hypothetical protein